MAQRRTLFDIVGENEAHTALWIYYDPTKDLVEDWDEALVSVARVPAGRGYSSSLPKLWHLMEGSFDSSTSSETLTCSTKNIVQTSQPMTHWNVSNVNYEVLCKGYIILACRLL